MVAAIAAKIGIKCVLVQESWVPHEDAVYDRVGNILLSRIMGAEVRWSMRALTSAFAAVGKRHAMRSSQEGINLTQYPEHPFTHWVVSANRFAEEVRAQEEAAWIWLLLGLPQLRLTSSCVRVLVINGHSEAVYLELEKSVPMERVHELLAIEPDVLLYADGTHEGHPKPRLLKDPTVVHVGRVRVNPENPCGLWLCNVADNVQVRRLHVSSQRLQFPQRDWWTMNATVLKFGGSDVPGVYTADPHLVPGARLIPKIAYDPCRDLTCLRDSKPLGLAQF